MKNRRAMGRCYYEWTQPLQLHRKITKDTGCRSRYIYFHHWRKRIYAACPNVTKIVLFSYLLITPSLTMMQKVSLFCLQRSRNNHESMVIIYIRYSSDYLSSTKSYDFRRSNGQRIQPHWVCNHIPFIGKWLFFNSRNHHKRKREIHTFMWRKKDYIVRASHIEYTTTFIATGQSTNNMAFILEPSIISMEEVIVKAISSGTSMTG